MGRPRKKDIDEVDLEILCALYFLKKATAFEISKYTGLSRGQVSSRLKFLVDKGILSEPKEFSSEGRLRKIYTALPKEKIVNLIIKWYEATMYMDMVEVEGKTIPTSPPEDQWLWQVEWELNAHVHQISSFVNWIPITEAIHKATALGLFKFIEASYIEIHNSRVRLSEKGKNVLADFLRNRILYRFSLLKKISESSARDLLKELNKI